MEVVMRRALLLASGVLLSGISIINSSPGGSFVQGAAKAIQGESGRVQRPSRLAEARVPGLLNVAPGARQEVINAPTSVNANEDFQVTVITTGSGCERAGDVSVVTSEAEASLMVYDFTTATRPGIACTMIYKRLSHTATLRFTKPGVGVIRVWGRQSSQTSSHFGEPAVIEHRVDIR
jgi:hypothetical protein